MRRYFYYTYELNGYIGHGVDFSDSGEFELHELISNLSKKNNQPCIVTFWHEISSQQYEKMSKFFENQNK